MLEDAGRSDVPVAGAICLVDGTGLPWFGGVRLRGVPVLNPRKTAKLAARTGGLSQADIAAIRDLLARRLPPA